LRADAFASYFDASHLSEDDLEPDLRSRWQAGADLIAEAGYRFTVGAGVFLGAGIEGMLGKTEIYTHHNRVAVIPPFRAVAELGFRTYF
jgi:opacity protein-like surface antigen